MPKLSINPKDDLFCSYRPRRFLMQGEE